MDQKRIRELEHKINTDYGNTTGVVVLKEGKLVYEKYFKGCTRKSQVHVYSVTKSIISILIGIICRFRRRWCGGQTCTAGQNERSGCTAVSTLYPVLSTARSAATSTAGLHGTTGESTLQSGGVVPVWSMALEGAMRQPSRNQTCRRQ